MMTCTIGGSWKCKDTCSSPWNTSQNGNIAMSMGTIKHTGTVSISNVLAVLSSSIEIIHVGERIPVLVMRTARLKMMTIHMTMIMLHGNLNASGRSLGRGGGVICLDVERECKGTS